jgi:predicted lipoprotein with Yx(FWY)xxD motif
MKNTLIYGALGLAILGGLYYFIGPKAGDQAELVADKMSPTPSAEVMMKVDSKLKTGKNEMTLYVFDKDTEGVSNCYDTCATNWPPYMVDDKMMVENLTVVMRKDGTKQYAMDGKPLYYFAKDVKAGDAMGDGVNGVWHLAK